MKLIVGLGNPGKKFEKTRHNMGFRTVDEIAASFQFPISKFQSIFNAKISKGQISDEQILLVKPQTFMNESGKAVKILNTKYKIQNTNLFVLHDDIDLPIGKIRISIGRSSAGHKGVESIIKELGSKNFVRFRIGIKSRKTKSNERKAEKFVLEKFSKDEEKILKEVIEKTVEAIETAIKESLEKAMAKYN